MDYMVLRRHVIKKGGFIMEHKSFSDRLREYLKENESKLIEGLSEIVAQPSVSSTGE